MSDNEKPKRRFTDGLRGLADMLDKTVEEVGKNGISAESVSEMASKVSKSIADTGKKVIDQAASADYSKLAKDAGDTISKTVGSVTSAASGAVHGVSTAVTEYFDENGNGEIDIEDVIIKGLRIKGIKINRAQFLSKELFKKYPEDVVAEAIRTNPMEAGIKPEDITLSQMK